MIFGYPRRRADVLGLGCGGGLLDGVVIREDISFSMFMSQLAEQAWVLFDESIIYKTMLPNAS